MRKRGSKKHSSPNDQAIDVGAQVIEKQDIVVTSSSSDGEKETVNKQNDVNTTTNRKPVSVEDFFRERPSLLTFEESESDEDQDSSVDLTKKPKKRVTFDGFLNLGLIFLVASTLRTMIDNLTERGLLFPNLDL